LNEDDDYSNKKQNPIMPWVVPTIKLYHEWRGIPSPIGDANGLPTNGQVIPINNRGGGNGPPRSGGGIGPLEDPNPRP
jgi:hypothetical protein